MTDGERLNTRASKYQPNCTVVTGDGTSKQLLLKRDPKRLFVRFRQVGGATVLLPYFGDLPVGAVATAATYSGEDYKSNDCPGLVAGEWYAIGTDALSMILIITDTYVGR